MYARGASGTWPALPSRSPSQLTGLGAESAHHGHNEGSAFFCLEACLRAVCGAEPRHVIVVCASRRGAASTGGRGAATERQLLLSLSLSLSHTHTGRDGSMEWTVDARRAIWSSRKTVYLGRTRQRGRRFRELLQSDETLSEPNGSRNTRCHAPIRAAAVRGSRGGSRTTPLVGSSRGSLPQKGTTQHTAPQQHLVVGCRNNPPPRTATNQPTNRHPLTRHDRLRQRSR